MTRLACLCIVVLALAGCRSSGGGSGGTGNEAPASVSAHVDHAEEVTRNIIERVTGARPADRRVRVVLLPGTPAHSGYYVVPRPSAPSQAVSGYAVGTTIYAARPPHDNWSAAERTAVYNVISHELMHAYGIIAHDPRYDPYVWNWAYARQVTGS